MSLGVPLGALIWALLHPWLWYQVPPCSRCRRCSSGLSSRSRSIHAPVELTCISLSSATSRFLFSSVPVGPVGVILHELAEGVPLSIASLSTLLRRLRSAASESGARGHSQRSTRRNSFPYSLVPMATVLRMLVRNLVRILYRSLMGFCMDLCDGELVRILVKRHHRQPPNTE